MVACRGLSLAALADHLGLSFLSHRIVVDLAPGFANARSVSPSIEHGAHGASQAWIDARHYPVHCVTRFR